MKMEIFNFNLISSLFFHPVDLPRPFGLEDAMAYGEEIDSVSGEEKLFCFELDESQYLCIEPDKKKLIGNLIFYGKTTGLSGKTKEAHGKINGKFDGKADGEARGKTGEDADGKDDTLYAGKAEAAESTGGGKPLELPRGNYFFAQKRGKVIPDDILTMAAEIQQEVLWQRFQPEKRLYLRYLFEDGCLVTQLLRPYKE